MSMSSIRSRISVVSSSFSSSLSWFASNANPDPSKDAKYIYSCFTKIPSLRLGPIPARKLIQDFEDCPGQSAVPLDVFKNLQVLELDDVDPRTLIGWDRICLGLRSLSVKQSGVEDVTDLLVDLVIVDQRRRRGEKVDLNKLRRSRREASDGHEDLTASGVTDTTGTNTDAEEPTTTITTTQEVPTALVRELPSLAWHSLRHLNLSSNNLTFIPAEPLTPLTALTHLDLSSNLLNTVPPALVHLPSLVSLNISDNLIDSVLGIYDTLPAIRVLNLAKNRLESLCGLERLYTLQRIDLRSNAIYESGEVGRLAPLPEVKEVWVKENPLVEEEVDWRVEVFAEFVKEGRWVVLDGEEVGYWEKQRVMERVPGAEALLKGGSRLMDAASNNGAVRGNRKVGEEEPQLAKDVATRSNSVVVVKKSRPPTKEVGRGRSELLPPKGNGEAEDRSRSGSRTRTGVAKRRNQRVVELDSSPQKQRGITLTESDRIKQAALSGNNAGAMDSPGPSTSSAPQESGKHTQQARSSPMENGKMTWTRKAGSSAAQLASADSRSVSGAEASSNSASAALAPTTMLLAIPPGDSPSKAQRRNPVDSSTLGRKSAVHPTLASDLFATDNTASSAAESTAHNATPTSAAEEGEAAIARQRITRLRTGSSAALARRSRVTTSLYDPDLQFSSDPAHPVSSTLKGLAEEPAPPIHTASKDVAGSVTKLSIADNRGEGVSSGRSDQLRKRIEALKSEVGDDWLRILARGGGAAGNRDSVALLSSVREEQAGWKGNEEVQGKEEERLVKVVRGKKSKKKLGGEGGPASSGSRRPSVDREEAGVSTSGRRREARIT